jgi:geranylgeranyl pyrophosphate synthase
MMIVTKMHIQAHAYQPMVSKKVSSFLIDDINRDDLIQVERLMYGIFFKSSNLTKNQNLSLSAIQHHFSSTGHQVRARLCLDACTKLCVKPNDMFILAAATELLHNASLIHDDLQDHDDVRRGKVTVWKEYGQNIAICAGDLLLSAAYGVLENYLHTKTLPKILSTLHKKTRLAIEGQSDDVSYKDNQNSTKKITIEEYVHIAVKKSGALLSLPLELALIAAEKNEFIDTAQKATEAFAVGYQIADDLEDISKDAGSSAKKPSINITVVLSSLGYENEEEKSIAMCQKYLNDAIYHAKQLPADSGELLVDLAEKLKTKIKY